MSESRALRRQEQLLAILAENGEATVEELATRVAVSLWTIRRDLSMLEERGVLRRLHGRAEVIDTAATAQTWDSTVLQQVAATNREGKQYIGRAVAQRIPAGANVALSGGSTTLEVARALKALHWQGEIVTNALDIAVETNNGVATLTGTVATAAEADHAATVTRGIEGVKQVKNNIKVDATKK